jgi:hypothetical protein
VPRTRTASSQASLKPPPQRAEARAGHAGDIVEAEGTEQDGQGDVVALEQDRGIGPRLRAEGIIGQLDADPVVDAERQLRPILRLGCLPIGDNLRTALWRTVRAHVGMWD